MYGISHIRSVSVGLDSQIWYLFIYITGYLNVRKISETMDFRTFVGPLLFYICKVNCPVQMSGSGVRLIFRSMSGSVQLKKFGFKSLTTPFTRFTLTPQTNHNTQNTSKLAFQNMLSTCKFVRWLLVKGILLVF